MNAEIVKQNVHNNKHKTFVGVKYFLDYFPVKIDFTVWDLSLAIKGSTN